MFGRSFEAGFEQSLTWQLTSLQVAPPFVVWKMCPCKSGTPPPTDEFTANPENAAYAVLPVESLGSRATLVTTRPGRPFEMFVKVAMLPAVIFFATCTAAS